VIWETQHVPAPTTVSVVSVTPRPSVSETSVEPQPRRPMGLLVPVVPESCDKCLTDGFGWRTCPPDPSPTAVDLSSEPDIEPPEPPVDPPSVLVPAREDLTSATARAAATPPFTETFSVS